MIDINAIIFLAVIYIGIFVVLGIALKNAPTMKDIDELEEKEEEDDNK